MGIQGLTSFINREFKNWQNEEVSGRLIIDGYSLLFSLYTCDWSHGGQYPEFREKLRSFFRQLERSKIDSIVVMDGVDVEGVKESVITGRKREAIKTIDKRCGSSRARPNFATGSGVLPPNARTVFIMLLQEMKVELLFADGEGDVTVFEISNGYSCPVLSNDSDYFMYDLKGGYIPLNRFYWERSVPIRADVFYHKNFSKSLGIADLKLRLVIPAIAGNDFISAMSDSKFTEYLYKSSPSSECHDKISIRAILNFIKTFPSLTVFKDSIKTFPNLRPFTKRKIEENCRQSEELYNSRKVSTLDKLRKSTTLRGCGSAEIPPWVLKQFRNGDFLNMYALAGGSNMLSNYIEDSKRPTCTLASKPIRKFNYGLTGRKEVRELAREGLGLGEENVAVTSNLNGTSLPSLEKISTLSQSERAHLLYLMLKCEDDESSIGRLKGKWHLIVAATRYWVRVCSPRSLEVEMLVLCFVVLHSNKMEPVGLDGELEYFRRTDQWMDVLHVLSQWQSCYGDALYLNQSLMLPLQPISPADLYDGMMLMFLVGHDHDEQLVRYLLRDEEMRLYKELVGAVNGATSGSANRRQPEAGVRPNCGRGSHQSGRGGHPHGRGGWHVPKSTDLSRYFRDKSRYHGDWRSGIDAVDGGSSSSDWRQPRKEHDHRRGQQDHFGQHGWGHQSGGYHASHHHGDAGYHGGGNRGGYHGDRGFSTHQGSNRYYGQRYHDDRGYRGGYHSDRRFHSDGDRRYHGEGDRRYHGDGDGRYHGDGDRGYHGEGDRRHRGDVYHGNEGRPGYNYHGDRGYHADRPRQGDHGYYPRSPQYRNRSGRPRGYGQHASDNLSWRTP